MDKDQVARIFQEAGKEWEAVTEFKEGEARGVGEGTRASSIPTAHTDDEAEVEQIFSPEDDPKIYASRFLNSPPPDDRSESDLDKIDHDGMTCGGRLSESGQFCWHTVDTKRIGWPAHA